MDPPLSLGPVIGKDHRPPFFVAGSPSDLLASGAAVHLSESSARRP